MIVRNRIEKEKKRKVHSVELYGSAREVASLKRRLLTENYEIVEQESDYNLGISNVYCKLSLVII
jgi:hypothetical protein